MLVRNSLRAITCIIFAAALFFPAFPIAGIGIHYGLDFSLSMENATGEQAAINDLKLDTSFFGGTIPLNFKQATISGKDLPVFINRTEWERHPFNLGAKLYIDIIPFLDCIELSTNYGMWQYKGAIRYPTSITFKPNQPTDPNAPFIDRVDIVYDSTDISFKNLGIDNPFIKNTPYAKLQFDLTVRKYLLQLPPVVKMLKIYGGAGFSTMFATPLLSAGFIEEAIGSTLASQTDVTKLNEVFGPKSPAMKKIGEEFMKELFTPHFGAHLDVGATIKFPVVPIGIYADGKFLLPFGSMDKNVDGKLFKGYGFLLNGGIVFII